MSTFCTIAALQGLICSCFNCFPCFNNDGADTISTTSSQQPLLRRDSPIMRPRRTYGTKRSASSAAATAIFGREALPCAAPRQPRRPHRPLADLTAQFSNINISGNEDLDDNGCQADESNVVSAQVSVGSNESGPSATTYTIRPLINVYFTDRDVTLSPKSWDLVLPSDSTLQKIAEASFAEVYRVMNGDGTSILKIMQLKVSTDPASLDIRTACAVETVISELRIMNALTEVPGFVTFKEVHLIQGKPGTQIKEAWDARFALSDNKSEFPDPDDYTSESTFLVIELGDAGNALEDCKMEHIEQVWDVLLGVIMALSRAEFTNEFEHRDLHENNICVIQKKKVTHINPKKHGSLKFGFSGIELTIIDYGLSRAKLNSGEIAFNDLEQDLELFQGPESGEHKMQFDTYRRTRNYLFTGDRQMQPSSWHIDASRSKNNGHTWEEYIPYSNVLWIRTLLHYLEKSFKKHGIDQTTFSQFRHDIVELRRRLNVQTLVKNGGFATAQEVLAYVVAQGWISQEQLEASGVDTTFLSDE